MNAGWRAAEVVGASQETATARTLRLRIPGLSPIVAGQHVDVRLTADDGYRAARSYSIAGTPSEDQLEITVDELADGEVSPYLVRGLSIGDLIEVRGPVGRWFTWDSGQTAPVQLIAGGSGVVPLMAMIRAHAASDSQANFRLLYSAHGPNAVFYRDELERLAGPALEVTYVYTREAPSGWPTPARRLDASTLAASIIPPDRRPLVFVCGSTPFVETVADWLLELGYPADSIKTERFGGTGGQS